MTITMWRSLWVLVIGLINHCSAQSGACPLGFVRYSGNQKCYGFVGSQSTWASALEYCSVMGAYLAQITDEDLQNFLVSEITKRYNETEITISTANEYKYHYLMDYGIDVRGQTSISFEVKACNDAHIALSKDKGLDDRDTYEIVIGGWGDHQSVIRDCKQCTHMDTNVQQQHPIDCNNFSPFWISWTNNVIKVGKGSDVGKQQFMSWNDTSPHDVNYVAFSTGFGASGQWKVKKDCKQCAHKDTSAQRRPLDCKNFSPFWISWTNYVIRVGKGSDVGEQQFMSWNDPSPHDVNYVAFSTGFGASGQWRIATFNPGLFWIGSNGGQLSDDGSNGETTPLYTNMVTLKPINDASINQNCTVMNSHRGYEWEYDNCERKRNFICEL